MKVLKKYDNSFSARLAQGMLEDSGIKAFILNENLAYSTAAINTDLLSIELVVDEEDYDEAKRLLEETASRAL